MSLSASYSIKSLIIRSFFGFKKAPQESKKTFHTWFNKVKSTHDAYNHFKKLISENKREKK